LRAAGQLACAAHTVIRPKLELCSATDIALDRITVGVTHSDSVVLFVASRCLNR
jgi:hypothetical protein